MTLDYDAAIETATDQLYDQMSLLDDGKFFFFGVRVANCDEKKKSLHKKKKITKHTQKKQKNKTKKHKTNVRR